MKVAAGVQGADAAHYAFQHGYRVTVGSCPTVGLVGGYTQGGGHSLLSGLYGLAADNVLEWEVVTAEGKLITATPSQNGDMYWALSGGGGGTYGVVLSMTTRLFEDGLIGGASFYFSSVLTGSEDRFWEAVSVFHSHITNLVDDGGAVLAYSISKDTLVLNTLTAPNRTADEVTTLLSPLTTDLANTGLDLEKISLVTTSSPTYYDYYSSSLEPFIAASPMSPVVGGHFFSRENLASNISSVSRGLRSITSTGNFSLTCVALNVNKSNIVSPVADNAVHPAWRTTCLTCMVGSVWTWGQPWDLVLEHQQELIHSVMPTLETITLSSAAYLNEANFAQDDWQQSFYGENYSRLREIKSKYDPDSLFYGITAELYFYRTTFQFPRTMSSNELPHVGMIAFACVAWLLFAINLVVYRLFFSPIAKFPGPKLAAITGWHEAYFDLIKKGGGQFPFEIKKMHRKYGPIVRINPKELHIDDPAFYDVLYSNKKAYDKYERFQYRFSIPEAAFSTASAEKHKVRRAALASFFSRSKVRNHNTELQAIMDRISNVLSRDYSGRGNVVNMQDIWSSFSADAIMNIVFARPMNLYQYPNFKSPFTTAVNSVAIWCHVTLHFGWTLRIINGLPDWLVARGFPPFQPVILFRREMERQIADILAERNEEINQTGRKTVFSEILASGLPPSELTPKRLLQEAQSLIGAGLETTAWILTIGTFHILNNPSILLSLKAELEEAIPNADCILPWNELEQLPYLSAVFLRIGFGDVERLPRINRAGPWTYGNWVIPPGTPVSMDHYHMHMDERVYEDPEVFSPERWLGNPKGPDGLKPLTAYLTPFGRGTRMCLGLHLAGTLISTQNI
ncbi:hypothetical protein DL771_008559 [Monosporascus sp. 5C6A]|nr:hypothetical protein DL771_008559 [Monosporascus sp. 5C6A]